jgi:hypothetical protein
MASFNPIETQILAPMLSESSSRQHRLNSIDSVESGSPQTKGLINWYKTNLEDMRIE